jgi:regulator of sigma D
MVNVIESKKKYKKQDEQYITGFMADHEMIDYVSNGYGHSYKMLKAQKGALQLMKLNPKTIEKIRTFKKETLRNGPDKNINYETEAKLKDKMDNKLPTDKKGLLSKILGIIK